MRLRNVSGLKDIKQVEIAFQEKLFVVIVVASMEEKFGIPPVSIEGLYGNVILNLKMMISVIHHIYMRIL